MDWISLFQGKDLEAYRRASPGNQALAITFDYMSQVSRPPHVHAASFFQQQGFDQFHIVCKEDIWYQSNEFLETAAIAARVRKFYKKVVVYGNSMGAYGALLISGPVEADIVIVFAPQYSVDKFVVPEETRWIQVTDSLRFHFDLADYMSIRARAFAVYDPFCAVDVRHIKLLQTIRPFEHIKVPMAGHYPASFLREAGLLEDYMRAMVEGSSITAAMRCQMRAKRRTSAAYYMRLAEMLSMRHRLEAAIQAATIAYSLAPDTAGPLETFFGILAFAPQYHAFADMAARLLETNFPAAAHYKTYRSNTWARLERYRGPP